MTADTAQLTTSPSPLREQAMIERGLAMDATSFERGMSVFSNGTAFQLGIRMAEQLAHSSFLPDAYRGNQGDCLVLIEYASRLKVPVIQLAQNMDVVKGRPGLRGTFLAGIINASPIFSRLKYEWRGDSGKEGKSPSNDYGCRAYATEIETGDVLLGTWIDWAMVTGEKWNNNTKWTTLREQMFMYRAASFWSRAHASDITLGLYESEELADAPSRQNHKATISGGATIDADFSKMLEQRAAKQELLAAEEEEAEQVESKDTRPTETQDAAPTGSDADNAGKETPPSAGAVSEPTPPRAKRARKVIE